MMTRNQYLAGECSLDEYYEQFITERETALVRAVIGEARIKASTDPHMNDIPLHLWDSLPIDSEAIRTTMKECGDFVTMAGLVCIAKTAARMVRQGRAEK